MIWSVVQYHHSAQEEMLRAADMFKTERNQRDILAALNLRNLIMRNLLQDYRKSS